MTKNRSVLALDAKLGKRLRTLRLVRGISQEKLAKALADKLTLHSDEPRDLSFQQIQKYELGINRISAVTLLLLAEILEVPILYFYEQDSDPLQYPTSPVPNFTPQMARAVRAMEKLPATNISSLTAFLEGVVERCFVAEVEQ